MITLTGVEGSSEFEAARRIANAFSAYWPGIDATPADEDNLIVAANVKFAGYGTNDIDVVVCGRFRPGRKLVASRRIIDAEGQPIGSTAIPVYNIAVAVEVKSHSTDRIRFDGNSVSVPYTRNGVTKWHSATEQNDKQLYTLQNYFQEQHVTAWVYRLVILDSVNNKKVPPGVVPREFTAGMLLTEIAAISPPRRNNRGVPYLRTFNSVEQANRALTAPAFRHTVPTNLDRKRKDRIASRRQILGDWFDDLGNQMLIFRGRGGTGKTVLLLQMAHRAFNEKASRTLLLTYNRALVADIRRSMMLMKVPSSPYEGGITVQTVMSLVMTWFVRLGVIGKIKGESQINLENYLELCAQAVQMFEEGAATQKDVDNAKNEDPDRLDFDYVLIDEGQDWPMKEAELLTHLYGTKRLAIADGIDQLVRGRKTDWTKVRDQSEQRKIIPLSRCLRMKANLARFANALAARADLGWEIEPNDKAGGGRVIVLERSYLADRDLHEELLKNAKLAGNDAIDFLFCVPPSNIVEDRGKRRSLLAIRLEELGWETWDGTDPLERKDFPRGTDTHRVVQYASCRGLEGWVVVAEGFDEFWAHQNTIQNPAAVETELYSTTEALTAEAAWRWCLIPITRPIDTLVITISDPNGHTAKVLREVSGDIPDIVEWVS
jgi:hypothetical protein